MSTPSSSEPRPPGRGGSGRRGGGRGGRGGGRGGKDDKSKAANDANDSSTAAKKRGGRNNNNKGKNKNKPDSVNAKASQSKQQAGGGNKNKNSKAQQQKKQQQKQPTPEELQKQEEARKQRERELEEQQRKQEEARQAVLRRKHMQERLEKLTEAKEILQTFVDTAQRHAECRSQLQAETLIKSRKDFQANKKALKTDLKKCTAFVKKVKTGAIWSLKQSDISKEIATLNLSRYVEEVASAVLEGKPKVADIPMITTLCCAMHQRYPDFLTTLLPVLWDGVQSRDVDATKSRRLYLRILTEFCTSGLLTETKPLVKLIAEATGAPSSNNSSYNVQDGNLVVAFGKAAGFEIFRVEPTSVRSASELVRQEKEALESPEEGNGTNEDDDTSLATLYADLRKTTDRGLVLAGQANEVLQYRAVDPSVADLLTDHCVGAFDFLTTSLLQTHAKLQKLEKRCEQDRLLSGTLPEAREKGLEDARKLKENLQKSVEALADVLAKPVPHLEIAEDDADEVAGLGVEVWTKEDGGDDFGPFDDEETRAFYCDIPDLLTTRPPVLLGLTEKQVETRKQENAKKYGDDFETALGDDTPEVVPATEEELDAEETNKEDPDEGGTDEDEKDTTHYKLTVILEEDLPNCVRREQIDEIADKFCTNHGSTKKARKRLSQALFTVPRNRFDLLPFYSRITTTLDRVWPDIAPPLLTDLEQQFHGQAKFKKNQNPDARLKTARYIGELTKFRVAPPIVFLRCIGRCLDDFTGTNVDVACSLLESSGRFLYRLKHTRPKIESIMETMKRLASVKNLDERSQALIKATFFSVNPPPAGPKKKAKTYPPLETYLRDLLIVRLVPTDSFVSFASKQIVRLPWSDPAQLCGPLMTKLMLKACRKGRYKTIRAIAMVASRIRTQKAAGEVTVRLIDAVLEELRWTLESPNFRDQQRVLTYARLLGELFDCSQVSGQLIIRQLYEFINYGHEIPEGLREASKRLAAEASEAVDDGGPTDATKNVPVYNSAAGISQTINEDEEMEGGELETKEEEPVPEAPKPVAVSDQSKYDPRVPTPLDPPSSAYRIKLVCALLEVCAKSLVTRNNIPRLKAFLTAFQRYLFTKSLVPADVEFTLLDTFDAIDSHWRQASKSKKHDGEDGFPRYSSWLDAHNATVASEESQSLLEAQELKSLSIDEHSTHDDDETMSNSDAESMQSLSDQGSEVDENDELGGANDEALEDDASEGSGETSDVDDSDDSDGSDSYSDVDDDEDYDHEEHMRQLEEEAFEQELRRVTMDAMEKGKNASRKLVGDHMPAGSQITLKKKPTESTPPDGSIGASPYPFALGGKEGITFQVLKKGTKGKIDAKELVVPKDTNLAVVATKQDHEAARERDVIKQRVLQYSAESAFAEDSGGNVYLEQERLQVIRNKPLSMEDIDKNFGTSGGNLRQNAAPAASSSGQQQFATAGRGRGRGGRVGGRGRGGRSSSSGRTLFR